MHGPAAALSTTRRARSVECSGDRWQLLMASNPPADFLVFVPGRPNQSLSGSGQRIGLQARWSLGLRAGRSSQLAIPLTFVPSQLACELRLLRPRGWYATWRHTARNTLLLQKKSRVQFPRKAKNAQKRVGDSDQRLRKGRLRVPSDAVAEIPNLDAHDNRPRSRPTVTNADHGRSHRSAHRSCRSIRRDKDRSGRAPLFCRSNPCADGNVLRHGMRWPGSRAPRLRGSEYHRSPVNGVRVGLGRPRELPQEEWRVRKAKAQKWLLEFYAWISPCTADHPSKNYSFADERPTNRQVISRSSR